VPIEIIALQETWRLKYPDLLKINGFQNIIFKNREKGQGGGVGFYIRDGLDFKIIDMPFNDFKDKIFESLTIEVGSNINGTIKRYNLTCIYRSPTLIHGLSTADQINEFLTYLDLTCNYLTSKRMDSYILTDSNINLLQITTNDTAANYLNTILHSGFIPINFKASHMQNGRYSLIDHILCNSPDHVNACGSILTDVSDHWITFAQTKFSEVKCKPQKVFIRQCTVNNMTNMQNDLKNFNWTDVTSCNNVDDSYDLFWDKFKTLYDLHLPLRVVKFNKNYHKVCGFMTKGLLVSRKKKD
jgi:hypothetical protein